MNPFNRIYLILDLVNVQDIKVDKFTDNSEEEKKSSKDSLSSITDSSGDINLVMADQLAAGDNKLNVFRNKKNVDYLKIKRSLSFKSRDINEMVSASLNRRDSISLSSDSLLSLNRWMDDEKNEILSPEIIRKSLLPTGSMNSFDFLKAGYS